MTLYRRAIVRSKPICIMPISVPNRAADAAQFVASSVGGRVRNTPGQIAGRQRTPVASMILKMLRGADWSRYAN
jgi:hypothetical protein